MEPGEGNRLPEALEGLDDETKAVCAAWFGMMRPGHGELAFGMEEQRPSARAQAALDRLCDAGVVKRKASGKAVRYFPLMDCSPLLAWLVERRDNPAFAFPLTDRIREGGSQGFRMSLEGSESAISAARIAVMEVEKEAAQRSGRNA